MLFEEKKDDNTMHELTIYEQPYPLSLLQASGFTILVELSGMAAHDATFLLEYRFVQDGTIQVGSTQICFAEICAR
jgi:hypothetical protein